MPWLCDGSFLRFVLFSCAVQDFSFVKPFILSLEWCLGEYLLTKKSLSGG